MATAYDPVSGTVIAFGGFDSAGHSAETWAFDGTTWTQLSPTTSPPPRAAASMAFDPVSQTLVMFGGYDGTNFLGDTWTFDGAKSDWAPAHPTKLPTAATGTMAFNDPVNGNATMFGGFDGRFYQLTTWQWTGTDWSKIKVKHSPFARAFGIAALDPIRKNVVIFGGLGSVNPDNTWTFDGTDWRQELPVHQPGLRYSASAVFEPHLGAVVAWGGATGGNDLDDTWKWTGSDWKKIDPSQAPSARESFAMAFDAAIDRIVVAGGTDGGSFFTDTWAFVDEGTFQSIGPGIGGSLGAPTLDGTGDLSVGSATGFTITVGNAVASAPLFLLASASQATIPFKGGTLYPFPIQLIVPLVTDGTGSVSLSASIPTGVPDGTSIFMQAWIADASAPKRMSGTNGLEAIVP